MSSEIDTSHTIIQQNGKSATGETSETSSKLTARFVVMSGSTLGKEFILSETQIVIGRGDKAQISVPDEKISRRHSMVEYDGLEYKVRDLGSTNGTFLNDKPLVGESYLRDGDVIRVGDTSIKFLFKNPLESQYHDKLYKMATIDALSGLYLRRHFLQEFERELKRAIRYNRGVAVLMINIDHFKAVNDKHGHLAGDEALKAVAKTISDTIRGEDTAGRYGGEEFVAFLPETKKENAVIAGQRLRESIEKMEVLYENITLKLTVSIGLACFPDDIIGNRQNVPDLAELLIGKADQSLYKAKNSGRNMVCFWD